jgi:cytochrome c oxidase cbb3-type subunit 4
MEIYSTLASVFTVISFVLFIGIVLWAYSSHRKKAFEAAANAPFALPDDAPNPSKAELLP